jgi:DNA-binding MarR family transcriptional regulator
VKLSREVFRCTQVLRKAKSCLAHHLSSGIELPAMGLLFYLGHKGAIRQTDIVAGSMLDPSTVSRQVNRLVREGLVERRPDPSDGRAVRLAVSEDGERALNSVLFKGQQYLSERLSEWDPHDVLILTELLHRFNDDLELRGP